MWIIPKQLHTSAFVPDTAALRLDCTELSEICARSLFVRSKPSPARTWSAKWRRDSWTALLSGRILNPSHGQSFVTAWTSSLAVIPASPSAQPESASAQKTLGTSGLSSQTEFDFFAPDSAISRMSKDTSPSDSERSLESWNKLVIQRRGEYSARLKSAHRTSASASSSWPSPIASEVRQGFQDRSRGMKGSQESLTTVVIKEQSEYPTPRTTDWKSTPNAPSNPIRVGEGTATLGEFIHAHGQANWPTPDASNHRDGEVLRKDNNLEQGGFHGVSLHHAMTKHGQAAPANPSTDGSRQGWSTPTATDASAMSPEMRPSRLATGRTTEYLARQVQWATPNAFCYQPPENTEQWTKRAEYQQTEKGVNLHKPIQTQVLHEVEKMWRTPSVAEEKNQNTSTQIYLQNQVGATPKAWATPIMGDSHLASTPEVAQKRIEEGKVTLSRQNPGKLNPRWVETLMGLPVGWVMPSCASPVTIEQTSFDSSATESCLPQPSEHSELFGRNSND